MEDIVAIKVTDSQGRKHFFLTWGRLFDATDPSILLDAIEKHLHAFGVHKTRAIDVCTSLQEASHELYFYEGLFWMCSQDVSYGKAFSKWKRAKKKQIRLGKEIYYLGKRR